MQLLRKIPDWLIYLVVLIVIIGNVRSRVSQHDVAEPPPELGPALPNVRPADPRVLVRIGAPASGVGTAFVLDRNGHWFTARHVVDSCDQVGLKLDGRQFVKVNVAKISPTSDVAILTSKWKRPPLDRDFNTRRKIGERGFFIGFPQGRPGEAAGQLIGRRRMVIRGRYRSSEPILAWSEIGRTRGLKGSLGGLSGGPVFNSAGQVIGLVSAESPRRGRVYTAAPASLARLSKPLKSKPASKSIRLGNYGNRADRLRRSRQVVQVACLVK